MRFSKLVVAALLASTVTPALADDDKIVAGMECQATSGSTIISAGRRMASGTGTAYVSCPVTRDETSNTIDSIDSHVWALDQSSTGSVSCSLYSYYMNVEWWTTSRLFLWSAVATYPSSAGTPSTYSSDVPVKLTFPSSYYLGAVSPGSGLANWYQMDCSIPGTSGGLQSGVVSYLVDENN